MRTELMDYDVVAEGLRFPEGPVVLPDGSLAVTEIARGTLTRIDLTDGRATVIADVGGGPNGAAVGPDGALYVCNNGGMTFRGVPGMEAAVADPYTGGSIQRVDLSSGAHEVIYESYDGRRLSAPNDLVFDADGSFWFTDLGRRRPRERDLGALYHARPDGTSLVAGRLDLEEPNGVGLSPDGRRIYVADTGAGRLWCWDVTGPGLLGDRRPGPLVRRSHGAELLFGWPIQRHLDSLAVEQGGAVVVATIGDPGGLAVVPPDGSEAVFVPLPDPYVTNVCFGGPRRRTAYVTLSTTGRVVELAWPRPGLALAW